MSIYRVKPPALAPEEPWGLQGQCSHCLQSTPRKWLEERQWEELVQAGDGWTELAASLLGMVVVLINGAKETWCLDCATEKPTMATRRRGAAAAAKAPETKPKRTRGRKATTDPAPPPEDEPESAEHPAHETKVETFDRTLRVVLSDVQIAERADRAAHLVQDIDGKRDGMKAAAAAFKAQIEELEGEHRRISSEVRDRATYDLVECERRYEYRLGRVVEIRLDTGEQLSERSMSAQERQMDLGLESGSDNEDEPDDDGDDDEE